MSPDLRALAKPLGAAGWRLFVERRHYEFAPTTGLAQDVPTRLRLETDPVECIHLAHDDAGAVVGPVSALTMETGRGFLLFIDVVGWPQTETRIDLALSAEGASPSVSP